MRSKVYSIECENDAESKKKTKDVSKSPSKPVKFEENKKSFDGEEYKRECDNYILRSSNHEMYFQHVAKSTLSFFDDKRYYESNTKSKPWNYHNLRISHSIQNCFFYDYTLEQF